MKYKISYKLREKMNASDSKELECVIDNNRRTIFEFTYELLTQENFKNLKENSSADEFYRAIEKFLISKLDSDNLQGSYKIQGDNFRQYAL